MIPQTASENGVGCDAMLGGSDRMALDRLYMDLGNDFEFSERAVVGRLSRSGVMQRRSPILFCVAAFRGFPASPDPRPRH